MFARTIVNVSTTTVLFETCETSKDMSAMDGSTSVSPLLFPP